MQEFYPDITDDLLVKHLLKETTPDEVKAVEKWLAESDVNDQHFSQLRWVWEQSLTLAATSDTDEHAAWERFQERISKGRQARVVPLYQRPAFRAAAAVIIIITVAFFGLQLLTGDKVTTMAVATTDSSKVASLPDGSMVTLNKSSELNYPSKFAGGSRAVTLKGEAFFNVEPDKTKPFIITVDDVQIRVVGTSFNVRNQNGRTEVIVETGIVQVTRNGKSIELKAAEKLITSSTDTVLSKEKVQDKLYNYYRTREFECDATPLWKLVEVLNEAYDAQIIIGRESLKSEQITTTFNNEPLDKVLDVVGATLGLRVERSGDTIILK